MKPLQKITFEVLTVKGNAECYLHNLLQKIMN